MKMTIGGQTVEILAVDFQCGMVDWRRTEGYPGACMTPIGEVDMGTAEAKIRVALAAELAGENNPYME